MRGSRIYFLLSTSYHFVPARKAPNQYLAIKSVAKRKRKKNQTLAQLAVRRNVNASEQVVGRKTNANGRNGIKNKIGMGVVERERVRNAKGESREVPLFYYWRTARIFRIE